MKLRSPGARHRKFLMLALVSASCLFAVADVKVREYGGNDVVAKSNVKFRDIYAFEPSPYVATSPFAIAFAPKFEAPRESWDVVFMRLSLLVGSHRAVYALDVGGLGNFTDYKMDGIGVSGLFNSVGESDGAFLVAGLFNFAAFDFSGFQASGFYSCTEGTHCGLQVALANYAGKLVGVQIGVFNYAERLNGVQVGLVNGNTTGPFSFMPVMNVGF